MLVGTIGIQWSRWYLAIRKCLPWRLLSPCFRAYRLNRNDFGGKNQPARLQRTVDDTLLTNFLTASSIVGALSIGLPFLDYGCTASALAYKIASLSTRMRDSLLSSVCYYKSYLPLVHRSIFEKQYVFQSFNPGRVGIDALVHDHQTVLAKAEGVWLPYLLTMPRRFMPSRLHAG